jgi:hypothetical protein
MSLFWRSVSGADVASDAFKKFGISRDELEGLIRAQAEVDDGLNEFMENEVVPYWRSVSPQGDPEYIASVKVTKKAKRGKGEVGATIWRAHFTEKGTKADSKGKEPRRVLTKQGWKTLTKDTPTEAQAPGEKTARHFGGSLGNGGIEVSSDD